MRVRAVVPPGGAERDIDLPAGANGLDLVRALGLAPDVHVLVRGEDPVPEDAPLAEGERIRILAVVSGG